MVQWSLTVSALIFAALGYSLASGGELALLAVALTVLNAIPCLLMICR